MKSGEVGNKQQPEQDSATASVRISRATTVPASLSISITCKVSMFIATGLSIHVLDAANRSCVTRSATVALGDFLAQRAYEPFNVRCPQCVARQIWSQDGAGST